MYNKSVSILFDFYIKQFGSFNIAFMKVELNLTSDQFQLT